MSFKIFNSKNEPELEIGNIPLLNIRMEFNDYFHSFVNNDFQKSVDNLSGEIKVGTFTWAGEHELFLTIVLQRIILGVEAYIPGLTRFKLFRTKSLTADVNEKLNNPFSFGGKSVADNIYNRIPAIFDEKIKLRNAKPDLWLVIKKFYSDIRNPLFHGYQVNKKDPKPVIEILYLFYEIYKWIDSWLTLEDIAGGGALISNEMYSKNWI